MLTQRFGSDLQTDPAFVREFLETVRRHPGSCDEVWLASNYGFPTLETHRKTVDALMETADQLRAAGIRVSLQISNTIGHGQYMCSRDNSGLVYDGSPAEHMVGPDGTVAGYCFCWNGEHFLHYIEAEMREYARLRPDRVWIDDDMRANNHDPVEYGCFCDHCIASFNARCGASFSRAELVEAINYGEDSVWRKRWTAFIRDGMAELACRIARTFHEHSPETAMGLQHAYIMGYPDFGYSFLFDALRRGSGKAPASRPGGGAYDDHNPADQLHKMQKIMLQNTLLPDDVTEIRPEIENLPFFAYGKSVAGTCYETGLYLAAGANAMSYSMLMHLEEPMSYHEAFFEAFSAHRAYWEALAAANRGTHAGGFCVCMPESLQMRPLARTEKPFAWTRHPASAGYELLRTAIPLAYGMKKMTAPLCLLHSSEAAVLSDEEIIDLMARPVLTDGRTLALLAARGFGDRLAARAVPMNTQAFTEQMTDHPVNAGLSASVYGGNLTMRSDNFRLVDCGGCEPLTVYQTSSRDNQPPEPDSIYPYGIASAIVPTTSGARWVVFGRDPWNENISYARRNQIVRASEYAAGMPRLSAILECRQQAVLFPRENASMETTSVSVLNCTVGRSVPLRLRIRRPAGTRLVWMTADGAIDPLTIESDGDDVLVTVPPIDPWTLGTLFIRP